MNALAHDAAALAKLATLPGGKFRTQEAEKLRLDMANPERAEERAGVLYWRANPTSPIPPHVYKDAAIVCPAAQQAAHDTHLAAFMKVYKKRQSKRPSGEERFEAMAAFGPGVDVVDLFSGRKFRT